MFVSLSRLDARDLHKQSNASPLASPLAYLDLYNHQGGGYTTFAVTLLRFDSEDQGLRIVAEVAEELLAENRFESSNLPVAIQLVRDGDMETVGFDRGTNAQTVYRQIQGMTLGQIYDSHPNVEQRGKRFFYVKIPRPERFQEGGWEYTTHGGMLMGKLNGVFPDVADKVDAAVRNALRLVFQVVVQKEGSFSYYKLPDTPVSMPIEFEEVRDRYTSIRYSTFALPHATSKSTMSR